MDNMLGDISQRQHEHNVDQTLEQNVTIEKLREYISQLEAQNKSVR